MPELSVILPVYNGEKYLRKTLECVYLSEYRQFELIIINDGSSDKSGQICQEYAEMYENIRYYEKENGGVASARNYGLDRALGKVICFIDQDDVFEKDHFLRLYNDIIENKCDCVISSIEKYVGGKRIPFQTIHNSKILSKQEKDRLLLGFVAGNIYKNIDEPEIGWTVWNCMYRKAFLDEHRIRFKSFVSYEDDWIFNIQVLRHAKLVYTEKIATYYWRDNPLSESHKYPYRNQLHEKQMKLYFYLKDVLIEVSNDSDLQHEFEVDMFGRILLSSFYNESMHSKVDITQNTIKRIITEWENVYGEEICEHTIKYAMEKYKKAKNPMKKIYGTDYRFLKLLIHGHCRIAHFLNRYLKKNCYGMLVI